MNIFETVKQSVTTGRLRSDTASGWSETECAAAHSTMTVRPA